MARPRKDGRLRMDTSLRIPVTSEQKALVQEATRDEPEGMAAWVRTVVLHAARQEIALTGVKSTLSEGPRDALEQLSLGIQQASRIVADVIAGEC